MEVLLSKLVWIPLSFALAFNSSEISLGEAYSIVCKASGGDYGIATEKYTAQFGEAHWACSYAGDGMVEQPGKPGLPG